MRINIASFGGRSHLLDTARELEKFGHEVRFYSYLPTKRTVKFGLKRECNCTLFYMAFPFVAFFKLFGHNELVYHIYKILFDYITAWIMKPCDVFIGQSPMHLYSLKCAKKKYKAVTILECGSSHALIQLEALSSNPQLKGKSPIDSRYIKRALNGYNYADYISVGAEHVKDSFLEHNFKECSLFVNNYGFDSSQFYPTYLTENPFDILIVGQWSYRKGADLLIELCRRKQYKLLHVGDVIDVPFPESEDMTHIDSVNQKELIKYYSQAKIFVLPSREEGLALVQAQAVACGLPIVCSIKTGGRDLRKYLKTDDWIIELNQLNIESLIESVERGLALSEKLFGARSYIGGKFTELSWNGYGIRYNNFIAQICNER